MNIFSVEFIIHAYMMICFIEFGLFIMMLCIRVGIKIYNDKLKEIAIGESK